MLRLLVRYVKFIGTGAVGTVVDMLVLWLLSDFVFDEGYWGEYVISPVISFQCAITVNYLISYFYVWKDRTRNASGSGKGHFFKLFLAYDLSGTAVFLLRLGVLLLIGKFTGWDVVLCNLLAMCISGIVNFIISNQLIFRRRKSHK